MVGTDWSQLTVLKLKEELKARGLAQTGKKVELVKRLEDYENGKEVGLEGLIICLLACGNL